MIDDSFALYIQNVYKAGLFWNSAKNLFKGDSMRGIQKMGKTVLDTMSNNKGAIAIAGLIAGVQSQAAVTVDATTGLLVGGIDTALYTSALPIVVGFVAFTIGVVAVIKLLRKGA